MCLGVQTAFLLLLFAANVCPSVDVNWLTHVINAVRREYKIKGQFCVAANIPLTQDKDKLEEILKKYNYPSISDEIETGSAFVGDDLIIAKVIGGPIHAEATVLTHKNLQHLQKNTNGNFLFIYSYLSACTKCTSPREKFNVVDVLSQYVKSWTDSAFAFTKVYDRPNDGSVIPRKDLVDSLCSLGDAMRDLKNIYRCDKINNQIGCYSCSINDKISEVCLDNNAFPEKGGVSSCRQSRRDTWSNRNSSMSGDVNRSKSPKRRDKGRSRYKNIQAGKHPWRTKSRDRSPSQGENKRGRSRDKG